MGKMEYLGHPDRHFWMTRSMARALGLNPSDAIRAGELSSERYADMVAACRKCRHVARCQDWLARSGAGADQAPAFCAHAETFNTLKENSKAKGQGK